MILRAALILALCASSLVALSSSAAAGTTHYVSTTVLALVHLNTSCSEPGYSSIQAAITASLPGDTIVVCDGVYQESLTIAKSVSLLGSGNSVVTPPAGMTGGDLITVTGGASVVMSGFVISGPGRGGCASIQAGVRVTGGAILDLSSTVIRDIRDVEPGTGGLSGCQNGEGIRVGHRGDGTGPGSLRLDGVIIVDFQKNGITVNGAGSNANIMNATVRGAGPTAVIAQNGIQVSREASATISTSTIRDVEYTPHPVVACGLLIFDANGVNDDTNIFLNNEKDKCTFGGRGGTTEGLP